MTFEIAYGILLEEVLLLGRHDYIKGNKWNGLYLFMWSCLFFVEGESMRVIKALNNNTALVKNNDKEFIVMGKGIAFNKKKNDLIDEQKIEKKYALQNESVNRILENIRVEDLELANQIIKHGEEELGYTFNDSILLALADHLSLALKRAKENLFFGTPLEWDIKLIYPNEYRYALRCVHMINETMDLKIPEQEASFIALHFINASANKKDMDETIMTTKIIQNILNIVRRYYKRDFDENSFDVSRFIIHIRYFVRRQINGDVLSADTSIAKIVAQRYPDDYQCAMLISKFLTEQYGWEVSTSEELYLTLHLNRMNTTTN